MSLNWNDRTLPVFNWGDSLFEKGEKLMQPLRKGNVVPAVNVSETEEAYQLELAAPGKVKEDFKVEVENGTISISSEEEVSNESENKNYTRKEYSYNSFSRSFTLPENVSEEEIEAKYQNGVLKLTLPKNQPTPPRKKTIGVS